MRSSSSSFQTRVIIMITARALADPRSLGGPPIETNQAAISSPCPRRAARHPWFRAGPSMSAETIATLPCGTATALSRLSRARRRPCARRALSTARSAARIARYAHDASSGQPAPPSGRVGRRTGHAPHPHADGPIHVWRHLRRTGSAPAAEPGGRCRRYGVPTGPRWAACGRTGSHLAR